MRRGDHHIPVPPFDDNAESKLFLRQLSLHVAALDGDRVTLPTFVLLTILDEAAAKLRHVESEASPSPLPAMILRIAVLSRFPAPWTPQGLHTALIAGDDWATTPPTSDTVFTEWGDPIIEARCTTHGTWTVTHSERGTTRILQEGLNDEAYVQYLLDQMPGHPFPYGWISQDLPGFGEVVDAAVDVRDVWDRGTARLPYLENWIATRNTRADADNPDA